MKIGETIKRAREERGLTQEELAEQCAVSRQAVSKWELGSSVPTAENLKILEKVLGVAFETEEDTPAPAASRKRNPWKTAAIALSLLLLTALLSFGIYVTLLQQEEHSAISTPLDPVITGIWFFDEDGTPLEPDKGDGWNAFPVGQRVYLLVGFRQGAETDAYGAALYATPTGTETYDQREQLAVQDLGERPFALFPLDFPEETMLHLEITLECGGGQTVTEMRNVIAVSGEEL